ncbi:UNVERIFIED_CONTAM: thiE [Trichonephila clavipes]
MGDGHMQMRGGQGRDDAQRDLQDHHAEHRKKRRARDAIGGFAAFQESNDPEGEQQIPRYAVIELHQPRIFKERRPKRPSGHIEGIGGEELAIHVGPGREGAARVDARDQRAQQDLQEGEMHQPGGQAKQTRLAPAPGLQQLRLGPAQQQHIPGDQAKDDEGDTQMRCQPVRGHIDHFALQTGRHHPPADRALQPAQRTKAQQAAGPACRDLARSQKAHEAQRPDKADHPAKLPVPPFPPEDRLERRKVHAAVLKLVFRALLIFGEFLGPVGITQRRDGAVDRLPFGDRQAGIGQPGQPADDDHRRDQQENQHEPKPDCATRATMAAVDQTRLRRRGGLGVAADLLENAAFLRHAGLLHLRRRLGPRPGIGKTRSTLAVVATSRAGIILALPQLEGDLAQHAVEGAHLGRGQRQPRPQVAQRDFHPRRLGRREEEARRLQPVLEVIGQCLDLLLAGKFGAREIHHLGRGLLGLPRPFIAHQQHALPEVERGKLGVHRHRDDGIGQHDILILQPGAFGAKQDADTLALGAERARIFHRAFRRHHRLRQFAPPRGRGKDEIAIGNGGGQIGEQPRIVQHPPRAAGHGHGLRVRPAVAWPDNAHPRQPEVQHRPRRRADVLAHLGPHEDENGIGHWGPRIWIVARRLRGCSPQNKPRAPEWRRWGAVCPPRPSASPRGYLSTETGAGSPRPACRKAQHFQSRKNPVKRGKPQPSDPMSDADRPQLYLVTPPEFDLDIFPDRLAAVLDAEEVACVRLALATRDEDRVARAADALREVAHARDVALVIENHVLLVERLGLDGVHLTDGSRNVRKLRKDLGDDAIIGAFCGTTRHEGISAAEAGADYVGFGPVGETPLGDGSRADFDLFQWWSEMIEVPVVAEGALTAELVAQFGPVTDFFGVGEEIWKAPDAAAALKSLLAPLG